MRCKFSVVSLALLALNVAACTSLPAPMPASPNSGDAALAIVPEPDTGMRIAQAARAELGAPYRYGGAAPGGFDCSGLVSYVHIQNGIATPRTAAAQQQAASVIPLDSLRPGDLLFYRSNGSSVDHVVIYVGDNQFVHAPRSGRVVALGRTDDPWYAQRVVSAGRLWPAH
jgi:cell wall-associated NlpC family hydrolase